MKLVVLRKMGCKRHVYMRWHPNADTPTYSRLLLYKSSASVMSLTLAKALVLIANTRKLCP